MLSLFSGQPIFQTKFAIMTSFCIRDSNVFTFMTMSCSIEMRKVYAIWICHRCSLKRRRKRILYIKMFRFTSVLFITAKCSLRCLFLFFFSFSRALEFSFVFNAARSTFSIMKRFRFNIDLDSLTQLRHMHFDYIIYHCQNETILLFISFSVCCYCCFLLGQ